MNEMWSVFRKQNETDIIKILESKKKKSIALTIICDGKAEFSVITPVLNIAWSFRNHSNILISCSRNISNYYY